MFFVNKPPKFLIVPVVLLVDIVVFANVAMADAPDNAKMAEVPAIVKFAFSREFAPKYAPPATCNAPVVELVDAVVFASVNADDAPVNAKMAEVPAIVKFAFSKEFAPKYAPPATLNAPVVELVDAVVFASVNADVAPDKARMLAVPAKVKLPVEIVCVPVELLSITSDAAPASGNVYVRDEVNVPARVNCVLADIPDKENPSDFDATNASITVFVVSSFLLAIVCIVVVST